MKLSALIKDCSLTAADPFEDMDIHDPDIFFISSNSKQIRPNGLFIAIKGFEADGHDYIEQAFEKGAAAVIAQTNPKNINNVILVENTRLAMASIAANFYGNPSKDLTLVGITGTNGKTTTTWLLESIFKACGFSTGVIGTINIRYNDQTFDTPVTTPDSIDLQKNLYNMKQAGVTHVIMEVSSHGLDLNRVDFCRFDAGVFTNLTQDHLDYHKTIDAYFDCKKRFFTRFLGSNGKNDAPAILNIDDPKGESLFNSLACPNLAVSTKKKTDIFAQSVKDDIHGLSGTICLPGGSFNLTTSLTGKFNLENILCAAGAAHALNIKLEQIKKGLENCPAVPGRLEKINTPIDRYIFVDYAHTPDALESILTTLKQMAPKRIITVFGCGGDRDRSKRPLMGCIACKTSDITIITSDNPRSENPDEIINDICEGLDTFDKLSENDLSFDPFKKGYMVEVDRKKALKKAVFISKPGDIIVAAGKGHETYQITNTGTLHFDDKEELKNSAIEFADQFTPIAWKTEDLSRALNTDPVFSNIKKNHSFSGISTDSRTIAQTHIFLALKGETFDGHIFIKRLIDQGIKGFITQKGFVDTLDQNTRKKIFQSSLIIFETRDTLTGLGQLARYQRLRSNVKLIAITGSSGKTTTRKITQEIFKTQYHTHATTGNFNNEIGLPLTLLNLSHAHEWAIVEMGMNHPGEISRLSRIALPDIAVVTNTAGVHLEGLGSVENVATAKAEIFEGIRKNATAILFADDPRRCILEAKARENNAIKTVLFFGSGYDADFQSADIKTLAGSTQFTAKFNDQKIACSINSPALFMVDNCLAAICAASIAGICRKGIKKGLRAFTPVSGRMNIFRLSDSIHMIDDTYNANPASVTQAINTLQRVSAGKNSIAVLGDMLELGTKSDRLHRQIGLKIALSGISKLFVFGDQTKHMIDGAVENGFSEDNIFHGSKDEIARKILEQSDRETWILVKGSRGMAMENIIQKLQTLLN
ncbi:UDP-N-acetylmuramoyl-L-alanyl-D-glutamate--2,6-diaminopimelate ligase [Desulfobacula toluolica]|uniref:Multifunctional fusion protein n=1 Tax=Desulfobacula toluolica (strain DSM 7467 / Tol2) TaxID=651182 RepID=K0NKW5_DESTT|nr:UDP-N-acetylmuramoyl-L-alanyl-D-glutamate--2,6-diaminopimelate ligase [Desulfobacula toluolica]CCK79377.1 MurEF: fusion protein; UDP-N-acetylmuramoyl-L-alanyl-D-glutamate-2,6-diaminopimelate ligase and UDP-N-acetylmuramoyl-tripeptide-D-alanyl-D-alanine ligase [Desulfobacula toluolica Tol2]